MKKTKSMYYQESHEATELYLFIMNTEVIYNHILKPIVNSLKKKAAKGIYDSNRAIDAYYIVATEAAKRYGKYYGNNNGLDIFNVTARYTTAIDLEKNLLEDVNEDL
jgi:hypothetical protein